MQNGVPWAYSKSISDFGINELRRRTQILKNVPGASHTNEILKHQYCLNLDPSQTQTRLPYPACSTCTSCKSSVAFSCLASPGLELVVELNIAAAHQMGQASRLGATCALGVPEPPTVPAGAQWSKSLRVTLGRELENEIGLSVWWFRWEKRKKNKMKINEIHTYV